MKRMLLAAMALAWASTSWGQFGRFGFGGSESQETKLTLRADGSSVMELDVVVARAPLERTLRQMEFYRQQEESNDNEPMRSPPPRDTKPYADGELAQAVRKLWDLPDRDESNQPQPTLADVQVTKEKVAIKMRVELRDLSEFIEYQDLAWEQMGLNIRNSRLETDAKGRLKWTATPEPEVDAKEWQKQMGQALKLTGSRLALTIEFPGAVVSSSLPQTEGKQTRLVLDGKTPATIEAAAKVAAAPVVIVAEAGGLKLAEALDSEKINQQRRQTRHGGPYGDLPLADAGPGFVVEATAVQVTTAHLFPGATKFKGDYRLHQARNTGMVVQARMFLPKGRSLLGVSQINVLKATDDKGTDLRRTASADKSDSGKVAADDDFDMMHEGGGRSERGGSVPLTLSLAVPSPAAQSVEVQAECVVVTTEKWKSVTVTDLNAKETREVDLATLLPGAKLMIMKYRARESQYSLQAKITGPPAIRQLEVKFQVPQPDRGGSLTYDRNYFLKDGVATRILQVEAYQYSGRQEAAEPALPLVIRLPEDPRRERVKFTLSGLDLF